MPQIDCIEKQDRYDPAEAITHIGGRNADGSPYRITQKEAVAGIDSGKWSFWVSVGGETVKVIVAVSRFGNRYIKTEADGEKPNNLLSLRECSLA